MNIFLPFNKELNPYLDEIIGYSTHNYIYDHYRNFEPDYDIVNVHWPEAIFEWKEPTPADLNELEQCILKWKKKSVLVYTKHDFQRNKGTTPSFNRLFELIEHHADVFIHLGEFSKNLYQKKYPEAQHQIIYHPLYINHFKTHKKEEARENLGIRKEDFVIIAPGNIRSYAERDLIINAFNGINKENKVLICTNVHSEIRFDFPGRVKLKRIIDLKKILVSQFKRKYQPPKYYFNYGTIPKEDLEIKMSAADLVFIPRIQILNSGNVFLGLTFNKIVVGPAVGNIEEQLKELGLPVFDPKHKKSVIAALQKGNYLAEKHNSYIADKLFKYLPENVARKTDDIFNNLK